MAEAFLKKALVDAGVEGVEVVSAGVAAYDGSPATSLSARAMAEKGYDLSAHRSQSLTRKMVGEASLILVMTTMHKIAIEEEFGKVSTPVFLWRERRPAEKQIADPWGGNYETYKIARDAIAEAVSDWVDVVQEMKRKADHAT